MTHRLQCDRHTFRNPTTTPMHFSRVRHNFSCIMFYSQPFHSDPCIGHGMPKECSGFHFTTHKILAKKKNFSKDHPRLVGFGLLRLVVFELRTIYEAARLHSHWTMLVCPGCQHLDVYRYNTEVFDTSDFFPPVIRFGPKSLTLDSFLHLGCRRNPSTGGADPGN